MRVFLAGILGVLFLSAQVQAQSMPRNAEIESVISQQMEAFRGDDFARAFEFAADSIQGIFGTPDRFGLMVERGYPMVHRAGEVRFLEVRALAGAAWQKVLIIDQMGVAHVLEYQMLATEEGWRIGGVQLLQAPDVGA